VAEFFEGLVMLVRVFMKRGVQYCNYIFVSFWNYLIWFGMILVRRALVGFGFTHGYVKRFGGSGWGGGGVAATELEIMFNKPPMCRGFES
jgi:hypothetical protein